jgi:hypothetical protein
MTRTAVRVLVVAIATLCAAAIGIFVVVQLGVERITHALHADGGEANAIWVIVALARQSIRLASGATILPALAVIIVGEVARLRSALYYIAGGGLAFAAIPLLAGLGRSSEAAADLQGAVVWQVFATAGFAAGAVYWLMAGRRA